MNLCKLLEILHQCEANKEVEGFGNPHSYRGYYDQLAFEPMTTTIKAMIISCEEAVGETYRGYKGGHFTMGFDTEVYLAYEGGTGQEITKSLLADIVWGTE